MPFGQPLYFYYEYETPLVEVKELGARERGAAIFQLSVPANSLRPVSTRARSR